VSYFEIDVEVGLVVVFADAQSSREAEIRYFDFVFREDEDVSGGEISVDESLELQILHSVADLHRKVAEREHGKTASQGRFFQTLEQRAQRSQFSHLNISSHNILDEQNLIVGFLPA